MISICKELRCPFNDERNGCRRFTTSWQCPVGLIERGVRNPEIRPNEYWLHAEDDANIDINVLREKLRQQVIESEAGQRQLETDSFVYGEGFPEFLTNGGSLRDWEKQQEVVSNGF